MVLVVEVNEFVAIFLELIEGIVEEFIHIALTLIEDIRMHSLRFSFCL